MAWLLGFAALWAVDSPSFPLPVAGTVLGVLMLGALVVTLVHALRQARAGRTEGDLRGALYGWSWFRVTSLAGGGGLLAALWPPSGPRTASRSRGCSSCSR